MLIAPASSSYQSHAVQNNERQETHTTHGKDENHEHNKEAQAAATEGKESSGSNDKNLEQQQNEEIRKLAARDREVRAHEAAHKAAGGSLTGAASFGYTKGPNGQRYASSGEVSIDTSKVSGDPQATLRKANQIRSAALAPAQPSNTDQSVAADAGRMAAQARVEILNEQKTEASDDTNKDKENVKEDSVNAAQRNDKIAAYQTSSTSSPQASIDVLA